MPSGSTAKTSLKLSSLTILSRILGLIRDHFQAIFFGIGPVAFAWEMAIFLPGMLRNLLVEGGAAQAFVPIYTNSLERSDKEARKTAGVVLNCVFLLMLAATLLSMFLIPYLLPLLTQQTRGEADFMIQLTWILLLFMLPTSITAILSGIANAHRHFVVPALAPIVLNIGLIAGFYSLDIHAVATENARALAWFFIAFSVVQLLMLIGYIKAMNFTPQFSLQINHPVVRSIFVVMLPAMMSTAIFHINQMLDVMIASYFIPLELGAVPALRFANRLIQLPTGIIGVALSTAILPILAHCLSKGGKSGEEEVMSSFHFAAFLTIPATLGLLFLGRDILNLLFYGGQWDLQSTEMTWQALQFYLISIPFYSFNKILVSIYFVFKDTKTPLRVTLLSVFFNFTLNIILVQYMGHAGIALSTAVAAILSFVQLQFYLYRKHIKLPWRNSLLFLKRNAFLWLLLGGFLYLLTSPYFSNLSQKLGYAFSTYFELGDLPRYAALPKVVCGVIGGFCLYIGIAWRTKNPEMQVFRDLLKRGR